MKIVLKLLAVVFLLGALAIPSLAFAQSSNPGDKLVLGGTYTLHAGETLRNLTVVGGDVVLEAGSTIQDHVFLFGGQLTINGQVQEDVHAYGGQLNLGRTAVVGGAVSMLGAQLDRADGAQVGGEVSTGTLTPFNFRLPHIPNGNNTAAGVLGQVLWLGAQTVGLTLLALLAVLLAPKVIERAGDAALGRPWEAGGVGLLIAIVTRPILVAIAITIIGIPVSLLLVLLAVALLTFGWIAVGLEVGKRLAVAFQADWPLVVDATLGTMLLSLIANGIGLTPCIGWIVPVVVGFVGMGGVILSGFGSRPYPTSARM